jgi:hypothetical protein
MFENLDQIDWKSLGHHVYGRHERISLDIRDLLSQDAQIREDARDFLLGGGQDYGAIYETTPHIIPFLFEILADLEAPGKAELLHQLSDTAANASYPGEYPVYQMRLHLRTYDAFKGGLDLLTRLLKHASKELRLACIEVLYCMTEDAKLVVPEFIQQFQTEQDEEVQLALLKGLKILFSSMDWRSNDLRKQYAPFFAQVVEAQYSYRIRVAAARALVECVGWLHSQSPALSPQVAGLLLQEFMERSSLLDYKKFDRRYSESEHLVQDLSRLGAEPLLSLLQEPAISAVQAHLIARGLLAQAFVHLNFNHYHWRQFPDHDRRNDGLFYIEHTGVRRDKWLSKNRALQAILDDDRVWEIPTNQLSFFYGLPDTREALRALLAQSGPSS